MVSPGVINAFFSAMNNVVTKTNYITKIDKLEPTDKEEPDLLFSRGW